MMRSYPSPRTGRAIVQPRQVFGNNTGYDDGREITEPPTTYLSSTDPIFVRDKRSSRTSLLSHSPSQEQYMIPYDPRYMMQPPEYDNTVDIADLTRKFNELFEENNALRNNLQAEVNNRNKLEKRNVDLSEKLTEARDALQETRAALAKVQQATEHMVQRRDEREQQLQKVIAISKSYEKRILELEANTSKAEDMAKMQSMLSSAKMTIMEKEEAISELERQLLRLQHQQSTSKTEVLSIQEEKRLLDVKLKHALEKIQGLEGTIDAQKDKISNLERNEITLLTKVEKKYQDDSNSQLDAINRVLELKLTQFAQDRNVLDDRMQHLEQIITASPFFSNANKLNTIEASLELQQERLASLERYEMQRSEKKSTEVQQLSTQMEGVTRMLETKLTQFAQERQRVDDRIENVEKMLTSSATVLNPVKMTQLESTMSMQQEKLQKLEQLEQRQQQQTMQQFDQIVKLIEQKIHQISDDKKGFDDRMKAMETLILSVKDGQGNGSKTSPNSITSPSLLNTTGGSGDENSIANALRGMKDKKQAAAITTSGNSSGDEVIGPPLESASPASILRKSPGRQASLPKGQSRVSFASNENAATTPAKDDSAEIERKRLEQEKEKQREREQREREQREKEQREREQREREQRDREQKQREQKEREQREQREREEREKEKAREREREEREKEKAREKEREKEKERERKEREKEKEREQEKEKEKEREREREKEKAREKEKEKNRDSDENDKGSDDEGSSSKRTSRKSRRRASRMEGDEGGSRESSREGRRSSSREGRRSSSREGGRRTSSREGSRERGSSKERRSRSSRELDKSSKEKSKSNIIAETIHEDHENETPKKEAPPADAAEDETAVTIRNLKTEINTLIAQHRDYKGKINSFNEEFKAKNGREPNKDERKKEAKDLFSMYNKLSKDIKKKLKDLEGIQASYNGSSPSVRSSVFLPTLSSTKSGKGFGGDDDDDD